VSDDRAKSTTLIHHPYQPPAGFASPVVPVAKGSTVFFGNTTALRAQRWMDKSGYTYGLHGTPTTFTLEQRLATLEGARHVLLAPSGLAAIALVNQALLQAGDELLLPDNVYGPSKALARNELARWGITHRLYDAMDAASLAAAVTPKTKLIWLEAPGSVTMEFPDLRGLVAAARAASPQATIALDNTWGAGLAFDASNWVST
jgi:cystathionine beta-lyase